MAGWGKIVGAGAVGLVLGVAGGGYGGLRLGTDSIASRWIEAEARHGVEVAVVLEHMRAGRPEEARAALEHHLNRHVFGLMPSARQGINLPDRTLERVRVATRQIRAYRERYPHEGETALDRDVRRYLAAE